MVFDYQSWAQQKSHPVHQLLLLDQSSFEFERIEQYSFRTFFSLNLLRVAKLSTVFQIKPSVFPILLLWSALETFRVLNQLGSLLCEASKFNHRLVFYYQPCLNSSKYPFFALTLEVHRLFFALSVVLAAVPFLTRFFSSTMLVW